MTETLLIVGSVIIANITTHFAKKYSLIKEYPRIVLIAVCFILSLFFAIFQVFVSVKIQTELYEFMAKVTTFSSGIYSLLLKPVLNKLNIK